MAALKLAKKFDGPKTYTIKRKSSGYAVFDAEGVQVTPEDVWPTTIKKLELILRRELGL